MSVCSQCQSELEAGMLFCDKCGARVIKKTESNTSFERMQLVPEVTKDKLGHAKLILKFDHQVYLGKPRIKIVMYGQPETKLSPGESVGLKLPYGEYVVRLSCLFRETVFTVDLKEDTTILIRFNRVTGKIDVTSSGSKFFVTIHK